MRKSRQQKNQHIRSWPITSNCRYLYLRILWNFLCLFDESQCQSSVQQPHFLCLRHIKWWLIWKHTMGKVLWQRNQQSVRWADEGWHVLQTQCWLFSDWCVHCCAVLTNITTTNTLIGAIQDLQRRAKYPNIMKYPLSISTYVMATQPPLLLAYQNRSNMIDVSLHKI